MGNLDWLKASVAISEAMCDTSDTGDFNESEYLLSLPFNGALMYYVDELSYFELAARNEPDMTLRYDELERYAPQVEWERDQ